MQGFYGWTPGTGGVHFHRIAEPLRVLAEQGFYADHGPQLDDEILSRVDTVIAHTLHDEHTTEAWHKLAANGSHRLVLDVDDAMWAPDWKQFQDHYTPENLDRLYSNVARAHVVTTPSAVIASYLTQHNPNVWVVPNTVPAYVLDIPRTDPGVSPYRWLGYQGSPSHERDWGSSHIGVAKFLRDHPDWAIRFVGGELGDFRRFPSAHVPWTANRLDYYRAVASFDVGLGPLRDTLFNRSKSSLRAVEYAALGVVPVLPDLDPYRHVIKSGHNGVLVRPHETLRGVLAELAREPLHIDRMSAQARADAENWTTEQAIVAWAEAWDSVA